MITRADKITALRREIALRKAVFKVRVGDGRMKPEKATHELAVMEAILHDYIGPEPEERVTK